MIVYIYINTVIITEVTTLKRDALCP